MATGVVSAPWLPGGWPGPTCQRCGRESGQENTTYWLIEQRPTIGGGMIHIVVCFACRGLVGRTTEDGYGSGS